MHLRIPTFPVADPVLFFAIATVLFLVVPLALERARVPGLIGLILVGAVIGPSGLGILARGEAMQLLGAVGLLYLMFLVGLELDLEQFRRHRRHSLLFGLVSFLLPQISGTLVSLALGYRLPSAILLGAMFASHTLVAYPIASRLGILKTPAVTTVLGGTLITDMLALFVLAVVTGARTGASGFQLWTRLILALTIYTAAVLIGVPRLARWFFRRFGSYGHLEFPFTIALLFASCSVAMLAGIEPIIGALLTGFALNRFIPEQSALMSRIRFASEALFVPFFLLSVGMLVDVRAFAHREAWSVIAALTGSMIFAKVFAAKLVQSIAGFRAEDGWVMSGLTVSRAAATMAIVLVGYDLRLFGKPVVNAVVVIILVTCVVGPWAVNRWGRVVALREESDSTAGPAPSRILVPISNPETRDALVDLGLLLRPPGTDEPLLPLIVVRDDGAGTEAKVAQAERMLGHAVLRASAASVPVAAMTRVDHNVASGIARGVTERRASIVVIGWDGRSGAPAAVFGSVLDQLLEQTRTQVVVARLSQPMNAAKRVVLVVPPYANRHPGFAAALRTIKLLAHQLAASLQVRVINDAIAPFERAVAAIKPDVSARFYSTTWRALRGDLGRHVDRNDVLVVLSARKGTLTWHPRMERLPRMLASAMRDVPLLVVYPGEPSAEESALPERAAGLDDYLAPSRVAGDLPDDPSAALEFLVDLEFGDRPDVRERALAALARGLREDSHELRPGIALPHARVEGVTQPMLFLGLSRRGIALPGARQPVRLVFLLLSPVASPDEHLRALSAVARACIDEARLAELLERYGIDGPVFQ